MRKTQFPEIGQYSNEFTRVNKRAMQPHPFKETHDKIENDFQVQESLIFEKLWWMKHEVHIWWALE